MFLRPPSGRKLLLKADSNLKFCIAHKTAKSRIVAEKDRNAYLGIDCFRSLPGTRGFPCQCARGSKRPNLMAPLVIHSVHSNHERGTQLEHYCKRSVGMTTHNTSVTQP